MTLFIHPENQKIIWETIHRHSSIESIHPSVRTDWFKGVVKKMYETIPKPWFQQKMTTDQLNMINQATIKYMINDLKPVILQQPQYTSHQQQSHQQHSQQPFSNNNSASIFSENKSQSTDAIQERFLEKQKEMENMLNVKAPSQMNFKIDEIDEPISNMDELIKQHISQRELDIQPVPLDISSTKSTVLQTFSRTFHSDPIDRELPKLVIMEELDPQSVRDERNIQITPVNIQKMIGITNSPGPTTNYKQVTFQEPMNHENEIELLKTHIQTIQNEVSELKTMMRDFLEKTSKTTNNPDEEGDGEVSDPESELFNLSNVESET